jgi:hypothetical protein
MNKWYFTWHEHTGSMSIFQTDQYEGRHGYDTKEEAVLSAKAFIMRFKTEISIELETKTKGLLSLTQRLDRLIKASVKLDIDSLVEQSK